MRKEVHFIADDGKIFNSMEECKAYETSLTEGVLDQLKAQQYVLVKITNQYKDDELPLLHKQYLKALKNYKETCTKSTSLMDTSQYIIQYMTTKQKLDLATFHYKKRKAELKEINSQIKAQLREEM